MKPLSSESTLVRIKCKLGLIGPSHLSLRFRRRGKKGLVQCPTDTVFSQCQFPTHPVLLPHLPSYIYDHPTPNAT